MSALGAGGDAAIHPIGAAFLPDFREFAGPLCVTDPRPEGAGGPVLTFDHYGTPFTYPVAFLCPGSVEAAMGRLALRPPAGERSVAGIAG